MGNEMTAGKIDPKGFTITKTFSTIVKKRKINKKKIEKVKKK